MMAYVYLLLSLTGGLVKGFSGKELSRSVGGMKDSLFVNLIRMLLCALIGGILLLVEEGWAGFSVGIPELCIFTASGLSMGAFCVCWMCAYRSEAYMFLSIFTMLGTVITCFGGVLFYHEHISIGKWCGIGLLICAVLVMSRYNKEIRRRKNLTKRDVCILVVGCLGASFSDFLQKVYIKEIGNSPAVFNFYTYFICAVLISIILIIFSFCKHSFQISACLVDKNKVFGYMGISLFLYMNAIFKTMAVAEGLTTAEIFPVLSRANLILSAILASILYKERITKRSVIGMTAAFAGVLFLNLF